MKSEPFLEELKDQNTKLKGKEKRKFILKLERMFLVFSLLGNAYIHGNKLIGEKPKDLVPKPFSQFWCGVAALLDRPPIISHSSLVLFNWNLVDKTNYHEEDSSNFDASVFQSGNIFINNTFQTCLDEVLRILFNILINFLNISNRIGFF